jgi:predicted ester cyclase
MAVEGVEGHKGLISTFLTAFPDWYFTIEDQWAFGDKVVTLWSVRGTHEGELMGVPPTFRTIDITGTDVHRVEDGQVVEAWVEFSQLLMMQQLGFELMPTGTEPAA